MRFAPGIFAAAIVIGFTFGASAQHDPSLPNVPGATNPKVTPSNIRSTICHPGFTGTIRPPVSYTGRLKRAKLKALGYKDQNPRDYELDHLISLEIGGAPSDPNNLWPEPYAGQWNAHVKDRLENELNREVCSGKIQLKEAQTCIASNWIACYQRIMPASSKP